jgi:hypothetical protein
MNLVNMGLLLKNGQHYSLPDSDKPDVNPTQSELPLTEPQSTEVIVASL